MPPDVGLFSITPNCVNRGNLIIEHAARTILACDSFVEIDAHQPLTDADVDALNACRAAVFPGATLLQPEDHASMQSLDRLRIPIVALGSALRSLSGVPDLDVARRLGTIAGSRDPFTHQALTDAGIESRMIGCPVLLLARADRWEPRDGPIVYSLGLGDQRPLEACAIACAEVAPTVLLLHAPERQRLDAPGLASVELESAEQAIALIRSASVVVTSRMHAYLTAMLFGVPAIFVGGWYDSRYSLLEFLGVPIEPPMPNRILRLAAGCADGSRLPPDVCFERADRLRAAQAEWMEDVGAPLGLRFTDAALAVARGGNRATELAPQVTSSAAGRAGRGTA